jgi:peptidoglycan hydrolase CwlO-like protein
MVQIFIGIVTAIVIAVVGGSIAHLIKTAIDRYYKRLDAREQREDESREALRKEFQKLNDNVETIGSQQAEILKKVNTGGRMLEKHTEQITTIKTDIIIIKNDVNNLKHKNGLPNE